MQSANICQIRGLPMVGTESRKRNLAQMVLLHLLHIIGVPTCFPPKIPTKPGWPKMHERLTKRAVKILTTRCRKALCSLFPLGLPQIFSSRLLPSYRTSRRLCYTGV